MLKEDTIPNQIAFLVFLSNNFVIKKDSIYIYILNNCTSIYLKAKLIEM